RAVGLRSTLTLVSGSGWQSGMSAEVCFAAMMPATRAACSGSPFLTCPLRTIFNAVFDMRIEPRAIASRSVIGLLPTSTIRTRPRASTCESLFRVFAMSQKERQAFERHRQIHAFQFDAFRDLECSRREVEYGLDARADDLVHDIRGGLGRHRQHRDADRVALRDFL